MVLAQRHRVEATTKGNRDEAELKTGRELFFNLTSAARHPLDFQFSIFYLRFFISDPSGATTPPKSK
jgi:hypothetical protein